MWYKGQTFDRESIKMSRHWDYLRADNHEMWHILQLEMITTNISSLRVVTHVPGIVIVEGDPRSKFGTYAHFGVRHLASAW